VFAFHFREKFFPGKKLQPPVGGAVSIFSPAKKSSRGKGVSMSGIERLHRFVRFNRARGGAPEGKRNGLPGTARISRKTSSS
jgi:hypothetical protein